MSRQPLFRELCQVVVVVVVTVVVAVMFVVVDTRVYVDREHTQLERMKSADSLTLDAILPNRLNFDIVPLIWPRYRQQRSKSTLTSASPDQDHHQHRRAYLQLGLREATSVSTHQIADFQMHQQHHQHQKATSRDARRVGFEHTDADSQKSTDSPGDINCASEPPVLQPMPLLSSRAVTLTAMFLSVFHHNNSNSRKSFPLGSFDSAETESPVDSIQPSPF
ncbi:unnamed protein product [Mesocestoides corti]|uniref:Secreted protein n=1 Tax=Mesocestoides corti TaxID=53468 RepID=A0A0R3UGR2_MESCO|nr:unnamed protein product [Mesocestoides corti]